MMNGHPLRMVGITFIINIILLFLAHYVSKTTLIQNVTITAKTEDGERKLTNYEKQKKLSFPYFRFEFTKILKKKTTAIPFILLLALVLIYGLSEDNRYEDFRNTLILNNQNVASTYGEFIANAEQDIAEGKLDPIRLESSEEALEEYYTHYEFYTSSVESF